jgi:hypothetical protein
MPSLAHGATLLLSEDAGAEPMHDYTARIIHEDRMAELTHEADAYRAASALTEWGLVNQEPSSSADAAAMTTRLSHASSWVTRIGTTRRRRGSRRRPASVHSGAYHASDGDPGCPLRAHHPGRARLAPDDVETARPTVLAQGGGEVGETVTLQTADGRLVTWCYLTDPEGNIIELQSWSPAR